MTGRNKQSPPLGLGDSTEQLPGEAVGGGPRVSLTGPREWSQGRAARKRSRSACVEPPLGGRAHPRSQHAAAAAAEVSTPSPRSPTALSGGGLLREPGGTSDAPGSNRRRWDRGLAHQDKIIQQTLYTKLNSNG